MKSFEYLAKVVNDRAAFVPEYLTDAVINAGIAAGYLVCGGLYDPETDRRVLYIA